MKKLTLIFLITFMLSELSYSQTFYLNIAKKPTETYAPISGDRLYSAIINTEFSKDDLMAKTKNFLISELLIDSSVLETIVYDEKSSEIRIPSCYLRHGLFMTKGMMGMKTALCPIFLYFDIILGFKNQGQIQMTFTNFDSESLAHVDENDNLNYYKGPQNTLLPADQLLLDESTTLYATETVFGKIQLWANGGLDLVQKASRGEYRKELSEQFATYKAVCEKGSGVWISKKNIRNYKMPNDKYWDSLIEKFESDNLVISVDNYRWENYFELNFNYFFKEIAASVSGKIDKIALDGNITFEIVDGKLLPIDPKKRKTWLTNGTSF